MKTDGWGEKGFKQYELKNLKIGRMVSMERLIVTVLSNIPFLDKIRFLDLEILK